MYPDSIILSPAISETMKASPLHSFMNELLINSEIPRPEMIIVDDNAKIPIAAKIPPRGSLSNRTKSSSASRWADHSSIDSDSKRSDSRWKSLNGSNPLCAGLTCPGKCDSLPEHPIRNPFSPMTQPKKFLARCDERPSPKDADLLAFPPLPLRKESMSASRKYSMPPPKGGFSSLKPSTGLSSVSRTTTV